MLAAISLVLTRRKMLMLHMRPKRFEQISDALAMLGADRDRIAEAEAVGLIGALLPRAALGLVGHDHHRRRLGAEPARDLFVEGRHALAPVDHEQSRVRIAHRRLGLLPHPARERVRVLVLETRRVDHPEIEPKQLRLALTTVPGDAWPVVDQCEALADETV